MSKHRKLILTARVVEFLVGAYLILGALPKGLDIDKFAVQIAAYKVISDPNLLLSSALFTLFVEVSLGFSMVMGLRMKGAVILVMQGMLIFFAILITYSWIRYGLEDCGCFPFFKMSPEVSLIKNAFLIAAGIFILWVRRRKFSDEVVRQEGMSKQVLPIFAKVCAVVLCGSVATAYAYQDIAWEAFKPPPKGETQSPYAQFILYLPEGYFNLGDGVYLVAVMSMTCDECMANVPKMNDLLAMPDMPVLVALCYEDVPGDMEKFRGYTGPAFPMHSLGDNAMLYYSLIGADSFRLSLVQDGTALKWWDGRVPTYDEIIQAMSELMVGD